MNMLKKYISNAPASNEHDNKLKKSLKDIVGILKPTVPIDLDMDGIRHLARLERAKEITVKVKK